MELQGNNACDFLLQEHDAYVEGQMRYSWNCAILNIYISLKDLLLANCFF